MTEPQSGPGVVEVELGGRTVTVPKGGLYDRYRVDTDLDEVAKDPRIASAVSLRTLPKARVESAIAQPRTPCTSRCPSRSRRG